MFWAMIAEGKTAASDDCKTTLLRRQENLQEKLNLSPLLDGSYLGGPGALLERDLFSQVFWFLFAWVGITQRTTHVDPLSSAKSGCQVPALSFVI